MTFKEIETFLGTSYNLFSNNVIYRFPLTDKQKASIEWKSSKPVFQIKYDKTDLCRIIFEDINLMCFTKGGSSIIYGTSGVYYPFQKGGRWEGQNGQITWERAGFEKDEMFAYLNKYKLLLAKSDYDVDSVAFVYKK